MDLILIMGTNPLPNYVVAKYFLAQNPSPQRIWVIHSAPNPDEGQTGTLDHANRLGDIIGNQNQIFQFCSLRNASSAQEIRQDIQIGLINHLNEVPQVHLNYTGGTKTMAVHIYNLLKERLSNRISFSYLDARRFCLRFDDNTQSSDLRQTISIDLENLIELHGFGRINEDENIDWNAPLQHFSDFINRPGGYTLTDYLNERNAFFRPSEGNKFRFYKPNGKLKLSGDFQTDLPQIRNAFNGLSPQLKNVFSSITNPCTIVQGNRFFLPDNFNSFRKVIDFLDGKWLEHYVYDVIQSNAQIQLAAVPQGGVRGGLDVLRQLVQGQRVWKNWEIVREGEHRRFELDIAFINGYQFFGISCTTSRRRSINLCKNKGFEIIYRSNQIGGDEAKMILITCLDGEDLNELEQELNYDTGSGDKLLVLGKDDLRSDILWERINNFTE